MSKLLDFRAQLLTMLAICIVLIPFTGKPILIPAVLISIALQGVQLEIDREN